MTNREKEIELINKTQDEYENILVDYLLKPNSHLKTINFTSPTGTGKTKMMADVIEKMDSSLYFFVITTLSKGQLKLQIDSEVRKYTSKSNVLVYGLNDYTKSTKIQEEDIVALLPTNKKIIWFRDEGHINTNRWSEILNERSDKIVNFSATNNRDSEDDIRCNFNHTMMLRTVKQQEGTPKDAINKLLEVKKQHEKVKNYNPCAIFRILDDSLLAETIRLCKRNNLKWINITDEEYIMKEICEDDNEYDVIINKFKIVEGIDIRRAHVLYMTNEPKNPATTIQVIGRCRRNALLYRSDIDILGSTNKKLLENTRLCYVFYNVKGMKIDEDNYGDLVSAFCDTISVEDLKANVKVKLSNGYMKNGLRILESKISDNEYLSGEFDIIKDKKLGFNVLTSENRDVPFYSYKRVKVSSSSDDVLYATCGKIITTEELKKYIKADVIRTATPLTELKNCWFKNINNGIVNYCNYGTQKISCWFDFNEEMLKEKKNQIINSIRNREYKLNIIKWYDHFLIELSIQCLYSFEDSCFYNLTYYYNENDKIFSDREKSTRFMKRSLAQKAMGSIENSSIDSVFKNHKIICFYYKVNYKKDKYLNIKRTSFAVKIEKKYIGSNYVYSPIVIFKYDYVNNRYGWFYRIDKSIGDFVETPIDFFIDDMVGTKEVYFQTKIEFSQPNYLSTIIAESDIDNAKLFYFEYSKKINDKESAIIGSDLMKYICVDKEGLFIEDKSTTSKIGKYSKLKKYLLNNYINIINNCKKFFYSGTNKFDFDTKCNSMLGYLIEYYIKYLLYGPMYLSNHLIRVRKECGGRVNENDIVIRACMLKYKELMVDAFGVNTASVVGSKMMSIDKLVESKYSTFKETIINLAENCISIVRDNIKVYENNFMHSPNLSINHISGLADLIDEETILDIKCTSTINEKSILQLLGYYYLSTKRSDLNIKYLMVLDVSTKRYIKINIESGEVTSNYYKINK